MPNLRAVTSASPGPMTGPGALRHVLSRSDGFAVVVELVPWAGELTDARGQRPLRMAADLAGDTRVTSLSVTDNAGGHVRLSPRAPGEALQAFGHDVIVSGVSRSEPQRAPEPGLGPAQPGI